MERNAIKQQEQFDVFFYRLDLEVEDLSGEIIWGTVATHATSLVDRFDTVLLDFSEEMEVDGVTSEEEPLSYNHDNDSLQIYLDRSYNAGDMRQGVPGAAPSGEYAYIAYVGDYELQEKIDSSYFSFTKSGEVAGVFTAWGSPGELFSELEEARVPSELKLAQNYPNPFNARTEIRFCLKEAGYTTLRIYNLSGQEVRSLLQEKMPAGNHRMIWEGKGNSDCPVSSGVYFCRLRSCGSYADIKRMVLLK